MKVKLNIETTKTTRKANVKGYGEVWFDEKAINKILTLKNVKHKFRVRYDRNNYGLFTYQNMNSQDVQFNIHNDGLHYQNTKKCYITLVLNVNENEAGYIKRQIKNSKLASDYKQK